MTEKPFTRGPRVTPEMDANEKAQIASAVGDLLLELVVELHEQAGWPVDAIIAGVNAESQILMARLIGGPAAAQELAKAADRVRNLPSAATLSLLHATSAGSA